MWSRRGNCLSIRQRHHAQIEAIQNVCIHHAPSRSYGLQIEPFVKPSSGETISWYLWLFRTWIQAGKGISGICTNTSGLVPIQAVNSRIILEIYLLVFFPVQTNACHVLRTMVSSLPSLASHVVPACWCVERSRIWCSGEFSTHTVFSPKSIRRKDRWGQSQKHQLFEIYCVDVGEIVGIEQSISNSGRVYRNSWQ